MAIPKNYLGVGERSEMLSSGTNGSEMETPSIVRRAQGQKIPSRVLQNHFPPRLPIHHMLDATGFGRGWEEWGGRSTVHYNAGCVLSSQKYRCGGEVRLQYSTMLSLFPPASCHVQMGESTSSGELGSRDNVGSGPGVAVVRKLHKAPIFGIVAQNT
jgi:hypothetical protein